MLILASKSPRRQEILRDAGIPFVVREPSIEEVPVAGETAEDYVRRLACEKASAVAGDPADVVLGADTIVVLGAEIMEKPLDSADAARMLRMLSGRVHAVLTGICLRQGDRAVVDVAATSVSFARLDEEEIARYVASGEPADKAGAYAIQGLASKYVERVEGCYFNVVGLPVSLVFHHLRSFAQ